jgi:hypothetical protein
MDQTGDRQTTTLQRIEEDTSKMDRHLARKEEAVGAGRKGVAPIMAIVALTAISICTLSACGGSGEQVNTPLPPATRTAAPATVTPVEPTVEPTKESTSTPVSGNLTPIPQQRPADFTVTYLWREGSMPPPFHYEYTISIGPGDQGKIEYTPDYPSEKVPTWIETFSPTSEELDNLYSLILNRKVFSIEWKEMSNFPVGGSSERAEISAGGKQILLPRFPESPNDAVASDLYSAIRALVPQAIWDKLDAQRKAYADNYGKETPTPTPTP